MTSETAIIDKAASNLRDVRPEMAAGGYSSVNGTIDFYLRIDSLCHADMTVLDLGAGRGQQIIDAATPLHQRLLKLQGRVKRIVGADVDPIVRENTFIDHAEVIVPGERMPFADAEFDLIYADWVLEHVATPQQFADEIARILKPGGWFCARTPNRWGFTGMVTNLVPSKHHAGIVGKLQPGRQAIDVFPTTYKLNTRGRLRRYFRPDTWLDCSYVHNPDPPYVLRSKLAIHLVNLYFRLTPPFLRNNLHIFLQKR